MRSDLKITAIVAMLVTLVFILIIDEIIDHWPEVPNETSCDCPCSTGSVRPLSYEVGHLGGDAPRQTQVRTDF
jgi:hypothetical protein